MTLTEYYGGFMDGFLACNVIAWLIIFAFQLGRKSK